MHARIYISIIYIYHIYMYIYTYTPHSIHIHLTLPARCLDLLFRLVRQKAMYAVDIPENVV